MVRGWLVAFLVVCVGVSGVPIASVEPLEQRIHLGESAFFNLTLSGDSARIRVFSPDFPDWGFQSVPLRNPIVVNVSSVPQTVQVAFRPLHISTIGVYRVEIRLEDLATGDVRRLPVRVALLSLDREVKQYASTVSVQVNAPKQVDPRETYEVAVDVTNANKLLLEHLQLQVRGELVNADVDFALEPRGSPASSKRLVVPLDVPDEYRPGMQQMLFSVWQNGTKITDVHTFGFEVLGYANVEREVFVDEGALSSQRVITFTNEGNILFEGPQFIEVGFFERLFSKTEPQLGVLQYEGAKAYVIDLSLAPFASETVRVSTNFLPLVIVVALLVVALVLYYLYRSPLSVVKRSVDVVYREGGIAGLKVQVHVRNRTSVEVSKVRVTDLVPRLLQVKKDFGLGSLQPSTSRSTQRGLKLEWDVEHLDPNEERLITYHVGAKLPIIGSIGLSSAVAEYKFAGRSGKCRSNRLTLSGK